MTITHDVIYGSLLGNNMPPPEVSKSCVNIPGQYKGKKTGFSMSEEMLGKHLLLVGGTGSGKTNVFYHIVHQLKSRLTQNDVMLIFDSKGDFYSKFFMENDVVIGNSAMYRKKSAKWNIFNEVIADGRDKTSVAQNIQEICKSLFAERVERNSSNPFFPNAARDLLASIIAIQIREGLKSNNRELKDLIDSTTAEELINMLKDYKDLASVASYI